MPIISKPNTFRVIVIERERGWGQRVDETLYFDCEQEAREWVENFNRKNMPPLKPGQSVPDYYCCAEYCGSV